MTRLHAVIAVEKGEKAKAYAKVTELHHTVQKRELVDGSQRTYRPKDEEGERLPSESKRVQINARRVLGEAIEQWTRIIDLAATKEEGNTIARADVVVGGVTLATEVPVTMLLTLEKQLTDVRTFIAKLPVLDSSEEWTYNSDAGVYQTRPVETTRTKKVPRAFEKAPATPQHPAQVDVFHEDVLVGYWSLVRQSGAMPADEAQRLLDRVDALLGAVKVARETANMQDVTDQQLGGKLLNWLVAPGR